MNFAPLVVFALIIALVYFLRGKRSYEIRENEEDILSVFDDEPPKKKTGVESDAYKDYMDGW